MEGKREVHKTIYYKSDCYTVKTKIRKNNLLRCRIHAEENDRSYSVHISSIYACFSDWLSTRDVNESSSAKLELGLKMPDKLMLSSKALILYKIRLLYIERNAPMNLPLTVLQWEVACRGHLSPIQTVHTCLMNTHFSC